MNRLLIVGILTAFFALSGGVAATDGPPSDKVYSAMPGVNSIPPTARPLAAGRPVVMLNISRDHQLFYKAYNEYSSYINSEALGPDRGYLHDVSNLYYGYFNPNKCYDYNGSMFEPSGDSDVGKLCVKKWAGNFLNWATMTRMDILRKALYGGYRVIDEIGSTVLERAPIPMDAHSFAKVYSPDTTKARQPALSKVTPFEDSDKEITICNTTVDDGDDKYSNNTTQPPLMRVVKGDYTLWAAHERRQCRYHDEAKWSAPGKEDESFPADLKLGIDPLYPAKSSDSNYGDKIVRVKVCAGTDSDLDSPESPAYPEKCMKYGSRWKPTGLLHEFGQVGNFDFGLMTGTYSNNTKGGILRKNASSFTDEFDSGTGVFEKNVKGIVHTINKIRIHGYNYDDGKYYNPPLPSKVFCAWQTIGLENNKCVSWGNPMGEVFIETLRYLNGGLRPYTDYGDNTDNVGAELGLPHNVAWVDPFKPINNDGVVQQQCRGIAVININASVISYDNDQASAAFSTLKPAKSLDNYINAVAPGGFKDPNKRWFFGRDKSKDLSVSGGDKSCTEKVGVNFSDVEGLCPLGPGYSGSFSLAGAAYWAHINPIRTDLTRSPRILKDPNFRVNTFGVVMDGAPLIEVVAAGGGKVVIQPSSLLDNGKALRGGAGTLVDLRVLSYFPGIKGKYLVVWEDSEQGGDYDQDIIGTLEWKINGDKIDVTTQVISKEEHSAQGFGYTISGTNMDGVHYHSGIKDDNDKIKFNFTGAGGALGCKECEGYFESVGADGKKQQVMSPATTQTYKIKKGGSGNILPDPLWLAAKWGGYIIDEVADIPNNDDEWDSYNADGQSVPDGDPDNYFQVRNPAALEGAIRRALNRVVRGSGASVAVSASELKVGSFKYSAEFSQDPVSGDVKAYQVRPNGTFKPAPDWSVGSSLAAIPQISRKVITNFGSKGLAFDWDSLSSSSADDINKNFKKMLTGAYANDVYVNEQKLVADDYAKGLVEYIRGGRIREAGQKESTSYGWRKRPGGIVPHDKSNNILGPVVSAAPWVQTKPSALYFDSYFSGYPDFAKTHKNRPSVLWVASDDGMVHGLNAIRPSKSTFSHSFISYVPGALGPRLGEQVTATNTNSFNAFVDGSPFTGDVQLTNDGWATFLFGSLGRGGRAIYALDVTKPSELSKGDAGTIFKWNFTADDDEDLGYILSDYSISRSSGQASPIVKLNNGKFAVIFGNGYQSTNGKAALMILPADGPQNCADTKKSCYSWKKRYRKIVADSGTENGLSTPTWVDIDNNGTADYVYAGDLKGNLWKFDISDKDESQWKVSFNGNALHTATDTKTKKPLQITSAPEVTAPSFGGLMINFGTGASYLDSQFSSTADRTHRFYGIWDGLNTPTTGHIELARLQKRTFNRVVGATKPATSVVLSDVGAKNVDYFNEDKSKAQYGWYVNLPDSSEMVVSNPRYAASSIFFTSIRPNDVSDSCDALPLATLFMLDPVHGLPIANLLLPNALGNPGVGVISDDQKVALVVDKTGRKATYGGSVGSGSGRNVVIRAVGNAEGSSGQFKDSVTRLQWREVPGMRTADPQPTK